MVRTSCDEASRAARMAQTRSGDSRAGMILEPRSSTVECRRVSGSCKTSIVVSFCCTKRLKWYHIKEPPELGASIAVQPITPIHPKSKVSK